MIARRECDPSRPAAHIAAVTQGLSSSAWVEYALSWPQLSDVLDDPATRRISAPMASQQTNEGET